jgi:hypothetical protein
VLSTIFVSVIVTVPLDAPTPVPVFGPTTELVRVSAVPLWLGSLSSTAPVAASLSATTTASRITSPANRIAAASPSPPLIVAVVTVMLPVASVASNTRWSAQVWVMVAPLPVTVSGWPAV